MKKTIIGLVAMVLAALSASLLGDQNIKVEEKRIENVFVEIGENLFNKNEKSFENLEKNNNSDDPLVMHDLRWAKGEFESPYENIKHHYEKHGDDVGVDSPQEYYDLANEIIDNTSSEKLIDLYCDGCIDYFDDDTDFIVGLNPGGSINTFYEVTSKAKFKRIEEHINSR